jgi:hypothetical protein
MKYPLYTLFILTAFLTLACTATKNEDEVLNAPQWEEFTLNLESQSTYSNPYTDVDAYVIFRHEEYGEVKRPAFWDGENSWKVRFASPVAAGYWNWESISSNSDDKGLNGIKGSLLATKSTSDNKFKKHGFLRMSEGKRNFVHADGTPFFMIGDTPWALPWRATKEDALVYSEDRHLKGFNMALLMSFCPDADAEGPDARATEKGFARAFKDVKTGHINEPIVEYFQYMDDLMSILIDHEIVPVYQPIFHGYGWKGQKVLGWNTVPEEYERYMKYLIARYGARPAVWLVGGDGDGRSKGIKEAGIVTEEWDHYQHPVGIHYNPFDEPSKDHPDRFSHQNKTYQEESWLDFQWCQTGHGGAHLSHKVRKMLGNLPVKGIANGEPTYEGIRDPENGAGWWQGHEAWLNFINGGTMGVVYGAGGIWQWKISGDEEGWPAWANSNVSWKEALSLQGSTYVGHLAKAFKDLDFTDMELRDDVAEGSSALVKPNSLYITYLEKGGNITVSQLAEGLYYNWFNPKTGEFSEGGKVAANKQVFRTPDENPWVLIIGKNKN